MREWLQASSKASQPKFITHAEIQTPGYLPKVATEEQRVALGLIDSGECDLPIIKIYIAPSSRVRLLFFEPGIDHPNKSANWQNYVLCHLSTRSLFQVEEVILTEEESSQANVRYNNFVTLMDKEARSARSRRQFLDDNQLEARAADRRIRAGVGNVIEALEEPDF